MKERRHNLRRRERLTAVYQAVCLLIDHGQQTNTANIARTTGLAPGSYLRSCLWELADLGMLIPDPHEYNGGAVSTKWTWNLPRQSQATRWRSTTGVRAVIAARSAGKVERS